MQRFHILGLIALVTMAATACNATSTTSQYITQEEVTHMSFEIEKSETEWRNALTPEEYRVLREKGTERAFAGEYWDAKDDGIYKCAACENPLFDASTKYKSGTGWPSFWQAVSDSAVVAIEDRSLGMVRVEIVCGRCGSHLGHLFNDGPRPTGLRYCLNSISLDLDRTNGTDDTE
jgi:peptide-methionine (R)-S-oxide reductase